MVSLFRHACDAGDLPQVQALLKDAAQLDLEAKDESGITVLVQAVRNGHVEVVRALLDAGADPSNASPEGTADSFTTDPAILDLLSSARNKKAQAAQPQATYYQQEGYPQDYASDPSKQYYNPPNGSYMYYPQMHPVMPPPMVAADGSTYYPTPPPPPPPQVNGQAPQEVNGANGLPPPEVAQFIPCRYFPACRYGPNCIFFHPPGPVFNGPLPPPAQYPPPFDPMTQQPYPYYPMHQAAAYPAPPNGVVQQVPTPPASQNSPVPQPNGMQPGPEVLSPMQAPYNPPAPPPAPMPFTMPMPAQYPPPGQALLPPVPGSIAPLPPPQQPMMHAHQPNGYHQPASPVIHPLGGNAHRRESSAAYPQAVLSSPVVQPRENNGLVHPLPPPPQQADGFVQVQANRAPPRDGGFGHARRGSTMRRNSNARAKPPCAFFPQGRCRNGNECRFPHVLPSSSESDAFYPPKFGSRRPRESQPEGSLEDKMQKMSIRGAQEGINGHSQARPAETNGSARPPVSYKANHPNPIRSEKRNSIPPRPQQRVPNADDFPVLAGSVTPPARSPGASSFANGGPTAAQILQAPAPVRKDSMQKSTSSSKSDSASDGSRSPKPDEKPPKALNGNGHLVNGIHEPLAVKSFAAVATMSPSPSSDAPAPVPITA